MEGQMPPKLYFCARVRVVAGRNTMLPNLVAHASIQSGRVNRAAIRTGALDAICVTVMLVAACAAQHHENNGETSDAAVARDAADLPPQNAARSDDNVPLDGTAHPDPLSANLAGLGDVECEVTISHPAPDPNGSLNALSQPRTVAWTYDAATRRLGVDDLEYELDEVGHIVRVYTREGRGVLSPKYTHHYDAHGRVDSSESYAPPDETLFLNTYDGDRLIMVETGPKSAPPTAFTRFTYRYHDRAAPHMWTRIDIRIGSSDLALERTIVDRRVSTTRYTYDGVLGGENTFIYAGDRIETLDLTQAIMGELEGAPNQRYNWVRDADDHLTEWTIDGNIGYEGRFPDGVPESKRTFSESCAPLLETFPWLTSQPRASDFRMGSDAVFPP
jgi:hypothetical protein